MIYAIISISVSLFQHTKTRLLSSDEARSDVILHSLMQLSRMTLPVQDLELLKPDTGKEDSEPRTNVREEDALGRHHVFDNVIQAVDVF